MLSPIDRVAAVASQRERVLGGQSEVIGRAIDRGESVGRQRYRVVRQVERVGCGITALNRDIVAGCAGHIIATQAVPVWEGGWKQASARGHARHRTIARSRLRPDDFGCRPSGPGAATG